jgi:hypothetical protein
MVIGFLGTRLSLAVTPQTSYNKSYLGDEGALYIQEPIPDMPGISFQVPLVSDSERKNKLLILRFLQSL